MQDAWDRVRLLSSKWHRAGQRPPGSGAGRQPFGGDAVAGRSGCGAGRYFHGERDQHRSGYSRLGNSGTDVRNAMATEIPAPEEMLDENPSPASLRPTASCP